MSLLAKIVTGILSVFDIIKKKPSWTEIATRIVPAVFDLVDKAIEFGGYDTKAKFDGFLVTLDLKTGVDPGAMNIFKDVTAAGEEEFFDGIILAARAYGYAKLKVPGYYEAPAIAQAPGTAGAPASEIGHGTHTAGQAVPPPEA